MQAVFQLSGFQFSVEEGEVLKVPRQKTKVGDLFDIDNILLVKDKKTTTVGTPTVEGVTIKAELLSNGRADKITVFKFKRRIKYRRTKGHSQDYSEIKIKKIVVPN